MIQKRVDGVSLKDFVKYIRQVSSKEREQIEHDVNNLQNRIGFKHMDVHDGNIMVDRQTGAFVALIDWDDALPL